MLESITDLLQILTWTPVWEDHQADILIDALRGVVRASRHAIFCSAFSFSDFSA